jgi:hypothetical protein
MCSARIVEPRGEADSALSFTAGLILGVPLDAELCHLSSTAALRVKVKNMLLHRKYKTNKL